MNYNDNNPMSYSVREGAVSYDMGLRAYMLTIYNYMASALALTGLTAYAAAYYEPLKNALYTMNGAHMGMTGLGMLVTFAPLAFVLVMSLGLNSLSVVALQATYWAFAAVMGLSLSSIFFVYTGASIVRVFFITAILFGSMSLWGYSSKRDLTGMGHFLMMGLWGIVLASIVNIFMHSSPLQMAISILGVIIFTGLTAYDTQKIKAIYYQTAGSAVAAGKTAIMGALTLYLDFINLFIMLLRFFGDRRD
ncbi:MAG TPA: Bax inhibitor-1/YccA family protein [Rickettsiales bacterium]|nr:Bax inhibitor-1/YccA family protein [Rickettsiales bacterium]